MVILNATESDAEAVALQMELSEQTTEESIAGDIKVKGRAAAIQGWAWDGTPSVLTLRWDPDGKVNDGGLSYLRKRHCLCCNESGFRGDNCRKCKDNACPSCRGSTVKTIEIKGEMYKTVIPHFYLRKDDVPFQAKFYGDIDCFLVNCPRRGSTGFQTLTDMYQHAASRHTKEWEAHQTATQAANTSELEELRKTVNALLAAQLTPQAVPVVEKPSKRERTPEQIIADKTRMAKARAGRKPKGSIQ